jgi:serine protease
VHIRALLVTAALTIAAGGLFAAPPAGAGPSTSDPLASHQWALDRIGAEQAWSRGTGEGVVVAVVDTGVDLAHEDLASKVVPGRDVLDDDDNAQDCEGHGTMVAGVIAAATDNGRGVAGTAPGARIMPVRALQCSGQGGDLGAGIRWAADHGAHVINVSAGEQTQALLGPFFAEAVEYAWSKGAVTVVAAGNDFVTGSGFADEPAIVVSATDRNDRKPLYSSGVGAARWGLAAPGGAAAGGSEEQRLREDILSTWWTDSDGSTYGTSAGTSLAAPHVAGAAAVLRGLGLSPQQTVDRLLATADDIGAAGRDSTFGHGRLNLARATEGLGPAAPPPATTTPPATTAPPGTAPAAPPAAPTTSAPGAGPPPPPPSGTDGTVTPTTDAPGTGTTGAVAAPGSTAPEDDGSASTIAAAPLPPDSADGNRSRLTAALVASGLAAGAAVAGWRLRRPARAGPAGR